MLYSTSVGPTASPVVETGSRGPISEATRATSLPLSMASVRPSTSGQRSSGSVVANSRAMARAIPVPAPRRWVAAQVDGAGGDGELEGGRAPRYGEELLRFAYA